MNQVLQKQISFLSKVDKEIDKLITVDCDESPILTQIESSLRLAQRIAKAARKYPRFDPGCLSRLREIKVKGESLWAPVFAWCDFPFHGGIATMEMTVSEYSGLPGGQLSSGVYISFPSTASNDNTEAVKRINLSQPGGVPNTEIKLTAECPPPPVDVKNRASRASDQFDAVSLIWEAQWKADVVAKDPLVIGHIAELHFLIDQYDMTKMERYIASEFCTNPEEDK